MPATLAYGEVSCASWELLRIRIAKHPFLSVLTAVRDVVTGQDRGMPLPLRGWVREAMAGTPLSTLEPLVHEGPSPRRLLMPGLRPEQDADFGTAMECVRAFTAEELVAEVENLYAHTIPLAWRSAVREPKRWLGRFCDLITVVWQAVEPFWLRADRLIDREIERVGSLVVRSSPLELLSSIVATSFAVDQRLMVPSSHPERYEIGPRTLTVVPLITSVGPAGHDLKYLSDGWLAYSLPQLVRLCPPQQDDETGLSAGRSLLAAALGQARADVLTVMMLEPTPMSAVARQVGRAPSTVTILVKALESAGFVVRERHGRQITVQLTDRGNALRELLA